MEQARAEPADQVKQQIRQMAEKIFDIVSEDPEEQHIAPDVCQPGMKKHTCEKRKKRHLETRVPGQERRDARRNH